MAVVDDELHQLEVVVNVAVCLQVEEVFTTRDECIQTNVFMF